MKRKNGKLLEMAGAVRKGAITELCLYEGIKLVADSAWDRDLAWYIASLWTAVSLSSVSLYHLEHIQGSAESFSDTVSAHLK